jgi:hypothetical protein
MPKSDAWKEIKSYPKKNPWQKIISGKLQKEKRKKRKE